MRNFVGRTARAGASGVALSLVAPSELSLVSLIQKAQDEKAQSDGAHAASDSGTDTDTASVSIALSTPCTTVSVDAQDRKEVEKYTGWPDAMIGTLAAFLLITAAAGWAGVCVCAIGRV